MRLTLRTMLAYMDGILGPEDAEEIGKRIEESEFATDLLHRTRDVMRRLRLAAPGLADRGPGLDPNTVAEYLDNTLHSGRVPDFEKVCLESDVQLAEVASCHQILALVLGEAAEIDSVGRERMYQLPQMPPAETGVESTAVAAEAASAEDEPAGEPVTQEPRLKPTVPDYLREPRKRRRLLSIAAVLSLVACFVVVVLIALGQFERGTPLGTLLFGPKVTVAAKGPEPDSPSQKPSPTDSDPSGEPPAPVVSDDPPKPGVSPADVPQPPDPKDTPASEPTEEPKTVAETATPPGDTEASEADPNSPQQPPVEEEVQEPEPLPPSLMGRLVSDIEILLKFDAESTTWRRVPPEGSLFSDQLLVALPTYSPKISLRAGGGGTGVATIRLLGGTEVKLLAGNEQEAAGLKVNCGRVRISPLSEAGIRLHLTIGNHSGTITFADADSTVSVEVTPGHVAGTNPETDPVPAVGKLYVKTGRILWNEGNELPAEMGTCLVLDEQPVQAAVGVQEFPEWTTADTVDWLDRRASSTLQQSLQFDRAASLSLLELTDHRLREVVWLATRCLVYVGHFDSMAALLDEPAHKSNWPDCIEELRLAAFRNPAAAASVRQAWEKQFAREEAGSQRMLWGYTNEDLQAGEDQILVERLNHKNLAIRVVSFWNLEQIVGKRFHYKAELTAAKRKPSVREWNELLKKKGIRHEAVADQKTPSPAAIAPAPSE